MYLSKLNVTLHCVPLVFSTFQLLPLQSAFSLMSNALMFVYIFFNFILYFHHYYYVFVTHLRIFATQTIIIIMFISVYHCFIAFCNFRIFTIVYVILIFSYLILIAYFSHFSQTSRLCYIL